MNINDDKLNYIIHSLTSIITRLIEINRKDLAMEIQDIRQNLLLSIQEDENDCSNS